MLLNSVITTPEDLKNFGSDSNDHGKPPNSNMGWFLGELLGQCMGLLSGKDWKRVRQIFNSAFTHTAAVAQIDVIERAARKYVEGLPLFADKATRNIGGKDDNKSFKLPVLKAFTKFPYFLTAAAIYGPMTETEERDLWNVTEKRLALNPYMFGGGPYRFETVAWLFDRTAVQRLRDYNREWRDYNVRMVQIRRARGEKTPIILYWGEYETGNMTLEEVSLLFVYGHWVIRVVLMKWAPVSSCILWTNC